MKYVKFKAKLWKINDSYVVTIPHKFLEEMIDKDKEYVISLDLARS